MADTNNNILREIWGKLCTVVDLLQNPTTTPSIDPEVVCLSNDGGTTVVQGIAEFDTSTVPSTKTLYLFDGTIAIGYSVVPCGKSMQYDYEKITVCVDGFSYTKWYVWDKTGDVTPNLVSILWLDQNDVPVAAPDPLLINNANCTSLCTPTISDAFADDISTLLPATNFIITKPECCRVLVTTSVGGFTLREKETYYATTDFNCPVTITDVQIVSGSCMLSDIHIISNFKG